MLPIVILLWFFGSLFVAAFGSRHKFGFWGLFFCSLLLSPIVGFLVYAAGSNTSYDHVQSK